MHNPYQPPASTFKESKKSKKISFEFALDNNTIVAEGEANTGMERIFLNNVLISSKRSFATTSRHHIIINNEIYDIVFKVDHIFSNVVRCSLQKNGDKISSYRCEIRPDAKILAIGIALALLLSFNALPVLGFLGWPDSDGIVVHATSFAIFLLAGMLSSILGDKIIDEE